MKLENLPSSLIDQLPQFSGTFSIDETARTQIADDFGHLVHEIPFGILTPKTFDDVIQVVRFARQHGLKVAPRGRGRSTNGQAQVKDGIVIDLTGLNKILAIHEDRIEVEAGIRWDTLLQETVKQGLALPVVTSFLDLSVGGVLSVGGISSNSYQRGMIVDNVLELQVVTGEGKLETCSPTHQTELFEHVLAGLGQCGIIVKATLPLMPAKTHARIFRLFYPNSTALIHDEKLLLDNKHANGVTGNIIPTPQNTWIYMLEAAIFYTPVVDELDNAQILSGLNFLKGQEQIEDMTYFNYANRLAKLAAVMRKEGIWTDPHPWFSALVPASQLEYYVNESLQNIAPAEFGRWPVILIGLRHKSQHAPLFPTALDEKCFLFAFFRTVLENPERIKQATAFNYTLFKRNRALGGKHYSTGTLDLSPEDWKDHFGTNWEKFVLAKQHFDPDNVLTPGQKIFPR